MIDVGLSVFRAITNRIHVKLSYNFCCVVFHVVFPNSNAKTHLLCWPFSKGRRTLNSSLAHSLASVAVGHSLVAPCGLGNSKEAEELVVELKSYRLAKTLAITVLGGENGLCVGGFLSLGCARGWQKEHMCPCKQGRRWSPSSGQACIYPSLPLIRYSTHFCLWREAHRLQTQ